MPGAGAGAGAGAGGGGRANVKKGQFENKRTFTWIDHHEEELVFTEVFKRTEEDEQEQGYGGKEEKMSKQIISPKLSSSSIYALKQN